MTERRENLSQAPEISAEQIALLEKLSNAVAVSGEESEVRKIVLEAVTPYADEVKVDAMGSVLVRVHARQQPALKVMLDAHMDEIGFMLVEGGDEGLFRFELVGGIDVRQLPGKPVLVGKDHVPGVIGAKPIHHTTSDERKSAIPLDTLKIDLGPSGSSKAKVGDRATFATTFRQIGPSLRGKALDDRLGVVTLVELVKHAPANVELCAAFTVQEEVGLRGAKVAAYALDPDLAIAIDSTPANDLPAWDDSENAVYNTRLGFGPAIYLADAGTLADPRLVRHLTATGDALGIPYQFRQPGGGGTNAGAIHKQRAGIPSVSISVPGRYAHTAALVARLSDWQATLALVYQALVRLPGDILSQPRE
jgi:putative aminopeptidase FrvX